MRKISAFVIIFLLIASGLFAQVTESTTITKQITNATRFGDILLGKSEQGTFERDFTPDSLITAVSHGADGDSVEALYDGSSILWTLRPDSINLIDSTLFVTLSATDLENNKVLRSDTATITYGSTVRRTDDPPGGYAGGAHIVVTPFAEKTGFSFTFCSWARLRGWGITRVKQKSAQIQYVTRTFVAANALSALATYSRPAKIDSATLILADSGGPGDRTFGTAIPGQYGYMSLFIDADTHNSNTAATLKVLAQYKYDGGDWAGFTDQYGDSVAIVFDSLGLGRGQVTVKQVTNSVPADSVRYGVEYLTTKGRVLLTRLKALWRD